MEHVHLWAQLLAYRYGSLSGAGIGERIAGGGGDYDRHGRHCDLVVLMRPCRAESRLKVADLTEFEWAAIVPVFPRVRGKQRVDDRSVLNGILWRLRTGRSWGSIPEHYGQGRTCRHRFARWRDSGVWSRIIDAVVEAYEGRVELVDASQAQVPSCWQGKPPGSDPVAWKVVEPDLQSRAA